MSHTFGFGGSKLKGRAPSDPFVVLPAPSPPATEDEMSIFAVTAPIALNEGNAGTTTFLFPVTRAGGLPYAAAVDWAVTGSGANPANAADFVGGVLPSGTLSFIAGQSVANISISVQGDTALELDEGFTVTLSNPRTIGSIAMPTAATTILNDDIALGGGPLALKFNVPANSQYVPLVAV